MTQKERVLRALRQRGREGITQADFDPPTIDGGARIYRVAARINNLKKDGVRVIPDGTRGGLTVYRLNPEAAPPAHTWSAHAPASEAPAPTPALPGAAPEAPARKSPYDPWDDDA